MKHIGVGEIVRVSVYAFIAWLIVLFLLSRSLHLSRGAFIAVHYLLDVVVFGAAFYQYHRSYLQTKAFQTTAIALSALLVYEAVFWNYFYQGDLQYLNYVDWILPLFLVVTSIYWAGKFAE